MAVVDEVETTVEGVGRAVASGIDPPAQVDAHIVCDEPRKRGDGTRSNGQVWRTSCDKTLAEQGTDLLGNTVP